MGEQPSLGALRATNIVKGDYGDDDSLFFSSTERQEKGESVGGRGLVGFRIYNGTTLKGTKAGMPLS